MKISGTLEYLTRLTWDRRAGCSVSMPFHSDSGIQWRFAPCLLVSTKETLPSFLSWRYDVSAHAGLLASRATYRERLVHVVFLQTHPSHWLHFHQDRQWVSRKRNLLGSIVLCLGSPIAHWRKILGEKKFWKWKLLFWNCPSCPRNHIGGGGGSWNRCTTDIAE